MNIFVGNLSFDAVEVDVQKLFEGFGNVASVVIVMRKEKKTLKSRGFGFVQMPDEQQALAAMAALNGKEFMGRVLNVDRARPKGQKAVVWLPLAKATSQKAVVWLPLAKAKKEAHRVMVEVEQYKHLALKDRQVRPSGQPGAYRGGRRTHSYMKQRGLAGIQEEAKPRQRSQDNPMRWRKRQDQPKPWSKSSERPQKSGFKGRRKPGSPPSVGRLS